MERFDLVVIGGGPGGYPAAIRAAQLGARVALVEREYAGGTCLNWGCIPTKTLIAAADLLSHLRRANEYGIETGAPRLDYAALIARKERIVRTLRGGVEQLLKNHGVTFVPGTASFLTRNRIQVTGGSDIVLEAGHTVIATGGDAVLPPTLPTHARVMDSRRFLDLDRLPASLLVLGGGVIGCEIACLAARLGVEVTLVEMLPDILPMLDGDVRRVVRRRMEEIGIRIFCGEPLSDVRASHNGVTAQWGKQSLTADALLCAAGRRPYTNGLNAKAAGIKQDARGAIPVNDFGLTSAATVYAVGDVTGGTQFAHAATSQGVTVAENIFSKPHRPMEKLVPCCIFTDQEVGLVGLTEERARAEGRAIRQGQYGFAHLGRALASGDTAGFVKWVADEKTGRLLGAQAVGPHATELIAEATLAIRAQYTADELARVIHCHPTFAEAWMESAAAVEGRCIHAAPRKQRA